jgi:polyhydroxybutyrate depolymerase
MKNLLKIIALLIVSGAAFAQTKSVQHKDLKRRYIIYTPKGYDTQKEYPVVFNFHGSGMTHTEQMLYTRFNETADKHGFIVVYPRGIKEDWNVGYGMSYTNGTDDIGFVEAMLTQIEADHKVDKKRVFATGLSRGGFFCQRIAAELPHRFAAVASVGALLPDSVAHYHKKQSDVGVLLVMGKADQVVNYKGKPGGYASAQDSYQYWKMGKAGSDKLTKIDNLPHDTTSVEILESAIGSKSIVLVSIENGGHTWPGADDFNIGLPIGLTSHELDINEYIWAFFSKQK